jgi:hypothetical protein
MAIVGGALALAGASTATAVAGGAAALGVGTSLYGQKKARGAAKDLNAANIAQAQQATRDETERYMWARGGAMGATLEEMMAKPGDPLYKEGISMFNPDGSPTKSAVLPLYLSGMENTMGQNMQAKYDAIQEAYNPEESMAKLQGYREDLQPAVDGQIATVQDLYSGAELAGRQEQLDNVNNARAQGMLMAAQRNAAAQDFTGRSGIVGNSGNAITNQLQALAQGYAGAGEKTAASNMALYENDLAQRKNPSLVSGALTGAANAGVAGLEQAYAPEKLASSALRGAGMITGTQAMPEVNVGAQTAVPGYNPGSAIMGGVNAGLGAYGLAQAFSGGGNAGYSSGGQRLPSNTTSWGGNQLSHDYLLKNN